ncbi:MAG TPA: heavy metal sensor histidine kinase [Ramlibacter sp.]|uniref:heavy metal sensor histidine kinase n=1 Tax=Ramlibacter sp. TaxID=1917967 RepID=UPI002BDC22F5|nr:heavy metal sensor histidine kinase [Ramlibacter sp.]HVZ44868.1 heavy metal sensor histidine kinase [Ramlibacter sp.]
MKQAAARALGAVRHSLTAQISLAVALVSVLMILFFGTMVDRFLARELRERNELLLSTNMLFIRDELAAAGDAADVQRIVDIATRRTPWLHAVAVDDAGRVVAQSKGVAIPLSAIPPGAASEIWQAADGTRYRVIGLRIAPLRVGLAVETTPTRELRSRNWANLQIALWAAAVLASLFGVWIARQILTDVRRFGATASRINALELRERLDLGSVPTELVESAVAFNRMLDRLEAGFDRLAQFSSELAHDLRTPIGNLMGEAQVALSRSRSADEYRAVIESSVEEYERLSRMIGNMLFLARADNNPAAIELRWIDLDAALERVIGYFELLAEERGVSLRLEVRAPAGAGHRAWADETMLVRAVSNLVSNALHYAPRETVVLISAAVDAQGACALHVQNEGPAIAPGHHALIFERFYRVDASRQGSASGSGLGLAIVRSIMDMHAGRACVESAPGRPTVFTLEFPAAPRARA